MIGRTLSHYRILERLGEGGMGEVYLAEDTRLERPVAIKVLRDACCTEEERARLFAEARLASSLNHPSIAVVYDVDEVETENGPLPFLAMEYVAGEPIDAWARRERPGLDRLLEAGAEVARALAEAHARGIVHRDVKPSNLLINAAGRVKVLDFGLALRRGGPAAPTDSTASATVRDVAGTLAYMAPEQAKGLPVDARADVHAFGAVLYELLSGRRAFEGQTAWEIAGAVLHREAPPLELEAADPRAPELAALVARLLAKEPSARPASLAAVADELDRIRLRAPEPPAPAASSSIAVAGFENLTGDAEDDWIGAGLAETIAADLARLTGAEVVGRERVAEARRRLGAPDVGADEADRRLGRALGARWVVAGAVQRFGESVRVTWRLADLERGGAGEGGRLDGRLDEIFTLQDRVVAELQRPFAAGAPAAASAEETTVVAAYEALSRGLLNVRAFTFEGVARAIAYFERAVALDPRYARAWAELANAAADHANLLSVRELWERALAAALAARRLRPDWARAHREVGAILVALGRDEEGIASLERAVELAPDQPAVVAGLARGLFLGRADFTGAARLYERAIALDPHFGWHWLQLAHCRTLAGELEAARAAAERAIELQEKSLGGREGSRILGAHMRLGHVAARQGRYQESLEHLQRELGYIGGVDHALRSRIAVELHLRVGAAQLALGRHEEARVNFGAGLEIWEQRLALGADEPFTRFYAASIHALTGDAERALVDLERAAAERLRYTVVRARIEPEFAALAGHPRFQALLARVPA